MYERYPISSIHESYCPVEKTRTVVIPALIAILGISLVVFFIKTQPLETQPEKGITGNLPEPEKPAVMLRAIQLEEDETIKTTMVTDPRLPLVRRDGIVESDFTQWM